MIVRFFNALGTPMLAFFQYLGEVVLLAAETFRSIFTHRLRWKLFLNQVVEIGLLSQVLVIITGGFTGAVFAAQAFFQFNKLGMGSAVGAVVSVSLCRELAPVLTALLVAGRGFRCHLFARSQRTVLRRQHGALDGLPRHHHGSDQSFLFRAPDCFHQLPQRLDRARRCCWRRKSNHRSGRKRLAGGFDC
jgi:hypothetical protein